MRTAFLVLVLVACMAALAQAQEVTCRLVDSGVYVPEGDPTNEGKTVDGRGHTQFNSARLVSENHTVTREQIPFRIGLRYVLSGPPEGQEINYIIYTYHPKGPGWASDPDKPLVSDLKTKSGKLSFSLTRIAKDAHYIPGKWTRVLTVDGKELCRVDFYFE